METSDENLVAAANQGDGQAFSLHLSRHYDLIFRLGFRILGSKADAEDLAQDICVALPGKLAGFRAEAKFTSWLHRVIVNAARDRMRRSGTRNKAADGWGEVEFMRRAEAKEARDGLDWLQTAMTQLDDDLRETVALVLGEEMTHAAAAEVLHISEGTVSWRMSQVKKALRAMAEDEEMFG